MKENKVVRIILSVLTFVTFVLLFIGAILGLVWKIALMFVTCFLLCVGFGFFSYKDFKHYFGNK